VHYQLLFCFVFFSVGRGFSGYQKFFWVFLGGTDVEKHCLNVCHRLFVCLFVCLVSNEAESMSKHVMRQVRKIRMMRG
jgi:hypothetical protein